MVAAATIAGQLSTNAAASTLAENRINQSLIGAFLSTGVRRLSIKMRPPRQHRNRGDEAEGSNFNDFRFLEVDIAGIRVLRPSSWSFLWTQNAQATRLFPPPSVRA
jgi:hypothetical protein